MTLHISAYDFLFGWLLATYAILIFRGIVGSTRRYGWLDVALGIPEAVFVLWLLGEVAS